MYWLLIVSLLNWIISTFGSCSYILFGLIHFKLLAVHMDLYIIRIVASIFKKKMKLQSS